MVERRSERKRERITRGRQVTVETLLPLNRQKRLALSDLCNHLLRNWEDSYSRLPGATPEIEDEILAFIKPRGSLVRIKRKLRKAHVARSEFEHSIVDLFEGRGRVPGWSVPVAEKKGFASNVYEFFETIHEPRKPKKQRLNVSKQ